jgi:hypothetical protein
MGGGIMTTIEIKARTLDCMRWDQASIDELRLNEPMSDHTAAVLQALREHSCQYTALLEAFLGAL